MHKFTRNLITEWRRLNLPAEDETFVVAVSGGADSLSLLLALADLIKRKKLGLRFVVAHYNHGLRGGASDADEAFVSHLTKELDLELALEKWNAGDTGNIEQNARNARYEFLGRVAENVKAYGILTAHTVNDQAETVLMNFVRGSGVEGLSGMKTVRPLKKAVADEGEPLLFGEDVLLIRPILSWAKRIDTEAFCRDNDVEYRYDTMNEDLAFKRVRIRKVLIPMLKDLNPNIIETVAKTAGLMQDLLAHSIPDVSIEITDELELAELKDLPKHELYRVLREWLRHHRGNLRVLELKHTEGIERLINSRKSGRSVQLPNGETVTRRSGMLVFGKIKVDK